jgi:hypothetical protein
MADLYALLEMEIPSDFLLQIHSHLFVFAAEFIGGGVLALLSFEPANGSGSYFSKNDSHHGNYHL